MINEELAIFKETNLKFINENQKLINDINTLNQKINNLEKENNEYKESVKKEELDQEELEFLKMNLLYSSKCQSKKLFNTGYNIGTEEYRNCILNRGKKIRRKKN